MSKPSATKDHLPKNSLNDSDDWDDLGSDDHYDSDTSNKSDRSKRKTGSKAKRVYERLQEDLRLKKLIGGDFDY
ncbi:MAG: hypothetical protein RRB22_14020 [Gammaproteobacteria bacterium]|nr:hypothetical protein [Gammaproteobacteria bacterium]